MDFTEALPLLRDGKRVTRRFWAELDGQVGSWIQIVSGPPFGEPVLMVWMEREQGFIPFAGAQRDILHDDWEVS